jgi:L-amino acid N-acyltransferase YncA
MTAIISPENTPSLLLAQKLGFREWVRTTYNGDIVILKRET